MTTTIKRTFGAITIALALVIGPGWQTPQTASAAIVRRVASPPSDLVPVNDPDQVPRYATWYSMANPGTAPMPCFGLIHTLHPDWTVYWSPSLGVGLGVVWMDDSSLSTAQADSMLTNPPALDGSQSGNTSTPTLDPNSLYLQVTNLSSGLLFANLCNATNQVYAIWSTTGLLTSWNVEMELWPSNQAVVPFRVPAWGRQSLFLRAEDWTGVCENGNTVPNWWLWHYFGTSALSDSTLDPQGHTLLYDYQNGLDPNLIQFSLLVTNQFLNTDAAPMQLILAGGIPSYYALLVNDTNTTNAHWQPYLSSNLTVNLGSTDGVYNVKVGLRGLPANATPTWQEVQFIRDTTPLLLTLTNLEPYAGSRPYIDPAGYANKALLSLSFQVVDANGTTNTKAGVVTDHTLNPFNRLQTTNWFEGVDLKLAPGTNTLSLTAVDLAGNTATLRFHYVFDTSTDTTPPALAMLWPQDGMEVAGTALTLRGTLDDDTATVSAQYLDADGAPTLLSGLVERGGQFWLQGLPLNPGTNTVLVTATDAAGNTSTTNLTLLQSAVVLTMNQPPSSELNYATVNLWGSISEPDYVVWVNGVQGVNNHGAWSADNVPITSGGTASFDITAYPPDCAPAAPSWTNYGIAQLAYPNPAAPAPVQLAYPNPAAPAPVHAHYEQDKQPVVYMQSRTWSYSYAYTNAEGTKAFTYSEVCDWSRESGGSFVSRAHTDDLTWPEGSETSVRTTTWPPDSGLLPSLPGRQVVDYYDLAGNLVYEAVIPALPPQPVVQHGAISNAPDICWAFPYNLTAQNVINLFTGKAVRDKEALFIVGANLSHEIVNLCATAPFLLLTTPIPPTAITLETFGQLAADGTAAMVLPAGQHLTITPHTAAALDGAWLPSVTSYNLRIYWGANDITDQTTNVYVGQRMLLVCRLEPMAGAPPITNYQWKVPGNYVRNYLHFPTLGENKPANLTDTNGTVLFYWVDKLDKGTVTCKVTARGQEYSAKTTFTAIKPTADWNASSGNIFSIQEGALNFGDPTNLIPGMAFTFTNGNTLGLTNGYQFLSAQVGTLQLQFDGTDSSGDAKTVTLTGRGLDTSWPYTSFGTVLSGKTSDTPNVPLAPSQDISPLVSVTKVTYTADFNHYLFFQPEGGIPVALKRIGWQMSMQATNTGATLAADELVWPACTNTITANNVPVTGNPEWTNNVIYPLKTVTP